MKILPMTFLLEAILISPSEYSIKLIRVKQNIFFMAGQTSEARMKFRSSSKENSLVLLMMKNISIPSLRFIKNPIHAKEIQFFIPQLHLKKKIKKSLNLILQKLTVCIFTTKNITFELNLKMNFVLL